MKPSLFSPPYVRRVDEVMGYEEGTEICTPPDREGLIYLDRLKLRLLGIQEIPADGIIYVPEYGSLRVVESPINYYGCFCEPLPYPTWAGYRWAYQRFWMEMQRTWFYLRRIAAGWKICFEDLERRR